MRNNPKIYTATAMAKIGGLGGYQFGIETKVFIQENKYDERIAIFKLANMNGHAGYHLYDSIEQMELDFDLGEFMLYEAR